MLIFGQLCLVYYWEDCHSTKFSNSKEEYKTVLIIMLIFFKCINFIEIKWMFVLIFSWKTAKSSKQFQGQNVQFFPTSSACVKLVYKLLLLLTDTIKYFGFFLSSLTKLIQTITCTQLKSNLKISLFSDKMAICRKVVDVICFEQAVPQCWFNAKFFF